MLSTLQLYYSGMFLHTSSVEKIEEGNLTKFKGNQPYGEIEIGIKDIDVGDFDLSNAYIFIKQNNPHSAFYATGEDKLGYIKVKSVGPTYEIEFEVNFDRKLVVNRGYLKFSES